MTYATTTYTRSTPVMRIPNLDNAVGVSTKLNLQITRWSVSTKLEFLIAWKHEFHRPSGPFWDSSGCNAPVIGCKLASKSTPNVSAFDIDAVSRDFQVVCKSLVGAGDILKREGDFSSIEPILWAALLETMSAKSAFRRLIGPVIEKDNVIDFIANEKDFPRSISHCLNETKQVVSSLPNHKETSLLLDRIRRKVRRFKSNNRQESSLHKFISSLQVNLTELDNEIHIKWFVRNTDWFASIANAVHPCISMTINVFPVVPELASIQKRYNSESLQTIRQSNIQFAETARIMACVIGLRIQKRLKVYA